MTASKIFYLQNNNNKIQTTMFQDLTSLIVDIGTSKTRVGYGGDDCPKLVASSYVSHYGDMEVQGSKYLVGDKYLSMSREGSEVDSIFSSKGEEGYAYDYEKMQVFLESLICDQLNVNTKDYSVLLSEDVAAKMDENKLIRAKMAEFLFDRLGVANIFFLKTPVLSCFSTGRSTAMVVDSGENFTRAVAVHDGFCLYKTAKVIPFGGRHTSQQVLNHVQRQLGKTLTPKECLNLASPTRSFTNYHLQCLSNDIKEAVSQKRSQEMQQSQVMYELPDKQVVQLSRQKFQDQFVCPVESQSFSNYAFKGLPIMITDNINLCDVDIKKELYSNILLTGGNILYNNIMEDTLNKVVEYAPANAKIKGVSVCMPNERKYLQWIGGSIVTSLSSFQSYWIGKEEWKEAGPTIIEKKCT